MRVAVIGIGSNSVRLLVADCRRTGYDTVLRDRCGTRLFAGLQEGMLNQESMENSCAAVQGMAARARALGSEQIYAFATSAARDARNGEIFCAMLRDRVGLELTVCTGEEEAVLSYFGAARPGLCGLIDIGGGSTEWIIGRDGTPLAAASLQIGGVRLCNAVAIDCAEDLPKAIQHAESALHEGLDGFAALEKPSRWVGVGGIFTSLAAMDKRLDSFDRSLVEGYTLTREGVERWCTALAAMSLEQRGKLPGLHPQRADIITHGAAILLACMNLWGMHAITVSDHGNLDGYLRKRVLCIENESASQN